MVLLYDKIASGSSGNSIVYFEDIMVDAGVPYVKLSDSLPSIKYLLLSHVHGDHVRTSTVKRIAKDYPDIEIFGNAEVVEKLKKSEVKVNLIESDKWIELGNTRILPKELKHDVMNHGFIIERRVSERVLHLDDRENDSERVVKIFHATDTYDLEDVKARDCDAYFVEFNHCEEIINKNITKKQIKKQYAYEINAKDNHQSNQRIMEWLTHNNVDGLVVPMHVSTKNNTLKELDKLKNQIEFLYQGELE